MNNPVYVFGHKNPDTDSIVSAIAYAEYKKAKGINAIASRLGSINNETEYLLEKFGFEEPKRLLSARSLLKEIEMDKVSLVNKDITMKDALAKIIKTKNKVLMVGDKNKHLLGLVSLDDLTYMWLKTDEELEQIIKHIKIEDILDTLEGEIVVKGNRPISGKMHVFPSLRSNVEDDSIVISRNEDEKIQYSLDIGASLIIIVTSSPVSEAVKKHAKDADATIITTQLAPLAVTRLIYQTPAIEYVMAKKEDIIYFNDYETVQEASKKIMKSRHRSYPVLDDSGKVIGALSRYHLFNYQKKQLILVDHNEYKQTIDNIEDGEVLEIVDHHRLGGFKSDNPISIITKTYGSTATIIASLFINENMKLDSKLAGLLLGAIISDTMNFNSPTTTEIDKQVACKLEKISKIKASQLSKEMIEHSESLLNKRFIDIVYDDFKEFEIEGNKVGLSQATCKSKKEFDNIKKDLQSYLEETCKSGSYALLIIMLTNPNGLGSYLLAAGSMKHMVSEMFVGNMKDNFVSELLSRKKQLLPEVIKVMGGK